MTRIWNDPAEFTTDAVAGFVDLYTDRVRAVTGGVVRARRPARPKVAVVLGGGSGHYPAFMGLVGAGFADGAVVGNIFTSPSAAHAYAVARSAHNGRGVILTYGNYAGDVMNFGVAAERLRASGIDARHVVVTDDVASAPPAERDRRRGIAGDFVVFKTMSAAAERGHDIDEVERIGRRTDERTFTIGVAYAGCTFPGADEPLFTVPDGLMGLGLGIHGEPGLHDTPSLRSADLAAELVGRLLAERPARSGSRVAVVVNGLGSTKYEELFVLWHDVARILRAEGLELVAPEVGELVTSLDMAGVSLTVCWLDEELEELWLAPADAPAFRRGTPAPPAPPSSVDDGEAPSEPDDAPAPQGDVASRALAGHVVAVGHAVATDIREAQEELGRLDAVAGDGDHGRGMVRGLEHACAAAERSADEGWGAGGTVAAAGDAWAEHAGGTSGVLWGAGLRAAGEVIGNDGRPTPATVAAAARAWLDTVQRLGGARLGDKTVLDAGAPFVEELEACLTAGDALAAAWAAAAGRAGRAAEATADLVPRVGRARPLAERSLGTPDPGAISFARVVTVIGRELAARGDGPEQEGR